MTERNASVLIRDGDRVLLIREACGEWRFGPSGGRIEPGEQEAAVREARESSVARSGWAH